MFRTRLQDIPRDGVEVIDELAPDQLLDVPEADSVDGDISVSLRLYRLGERVRVTGRLRLALIMACNRCLEPSRHPLEVDVEAIVLPIHEQDAATRLSEDHEDGSTAVLLEDGGELSLGQILREQIFLDWPVGVLCDPACKGLCPECGANLNERTCSCAAQDVDPRWAPLQGLKKSDET